jgi:hypothetical protein
MRKIIQGIPLLLAPLLLAIGTAILAAAPLWSAAAQPAPHPAQKAAAAPIVGAGQIFEALTQPDRPAEIETLRDLRNTLAGEPDSQGMVTARKKLDALLQVEEGGGDMPPALVMSGIASRIDAAMTALEQARRAPASVAGSAATPASSALSGSALPPWLVPGLASVSAMLAVALAASLAVLAVRSSQKEENEEVRDALSKIRRRLESAGTTAVAGHTHDLTAAASEEAADALRLAAGAMDRLGGAAKDAENRVLSVADTAEARLNAAAAMAVQLEQWVEAIPGRLAEAIDAMEAGGLPALEAAAGRICEEQAVLGELTQALPPLVEEMRACTAGLADGLGTHGAALADSAARAEAATEALPVLLGELEQTAGVHKHVAMKGGEALAASLAAMGQAASLGQHFETLAGTLPNIVAGALAAANAGGTGALAAAHQELANSADLLAELSNLSIGHAAMLEDIFGRFDKLASDLPATGQVLHAASAHLIRQIEQDTRCAESLRQVADMASDVCGQASEQAEALPQRITMLLESLETRSVLAFDAAGEKFLAGAGAVAQAAASMPGIGQVLEAASAHLYQQIALDTQQAEKLRQASGVAAALCGEAGLLADALPRRIEALVQSLETQGVQAIEAACDTLAGCATPMGDAAPSDHAAMLAEAARQMRTETSLLVDAARVRTESGDAAADRMIAAVDGLQDTADRMFHLFARLDSALAPTEPMGALPMEAGHMEAAQMEAGHMQAGQMDLGQHGALASLLEALTARADACLSALPAEAAALAAIAAQMRGDAAALGAAAEQVAEGAASTQDRMPPELAQIVIALQAACRRLEEDLAGLGGTGAALREDAAMLAGQSHRSQAETHAAQAALAAMARESRAALHEASELLARAGAAIPAAASAPNPALINLETAIGKVQDAAARLQAGAEAQEAASTRATLAASEVARLVASPSFAAPSMTAKGARPEPGTTLARLTGLATEAECLQDAAETYAAAALRGEAVQLPPELVSQTPIMLAAIEASIHRLRGTATALALASDAHRKAA